MNRCITGCALVASMLGSCRTPSSSDSGVPGAVDESAVIEVIDDARPKLERCLMLGSPEAAWMRVGFEIDAQGKPGELEVSPVGLRRTRIGQCARRRVASLRFVPGASVRTSISFRVDGPYRWPPPQSLPARPAAFGRPFPQESIGGYPTEQLQPGRGRRLAPGDQVFLHLSVWTLAGVLLTSTHLQDQPLMRHVGKGPIESLLESMQVGEQRLFWMPRSSARPMLEFGGAGAVVQIELVGVDPPPRPAREATLPLVRGGEPIVRVRPCEELGKKVCDATPYCYSTGVEDPSCHWQSPSTVAFVEEIERLCEATGGVWRPPQRSRAWHVSMEATQRCRCPLSTREGYVEEMSVFLPERGCVDEAEYCDELGGTVEAGPTGRLRCTRYGHELEMHWQLQMEWRRR